LRGVSTIFNPVTMFGLLIMIVLTSLAFNTMMFLLMVRIEDPLVPRAMFGILNTLLFFPAARSIPFRRFPVAEGHRQVRSVYLCGRRLQMSAAQGNDLSAVWGDMLFLSIFAAVTLGIAIPLFKRTL
jgi:ABC-2 type transport system permease protein